MSFVVRSSAKIRRGHERDDFTKERRAKPKTKPRYREYPEERQTQPCKVVIRNLPGHFSKEQFLQHVSPIPDYTYFAFHGPDPTLANYARCRVYIRFRTEDDVGIFKEKFDGYVFVDSRGHELRCIVELAPYQRTAEQNREKFDPKCGQITEAEEYKRFLEDLEKKKEQGPSSSAARVQASLAAIETKKEESTVTPLMEYLLNHKVEDDYRGPGGRFGRKERNRDRNRGNPTPKKDGIDKGMGKPKDISGKDSAPKPGPGGVKVMELSRPKDADAQVSGGKGITGSVSNHSMAAPKRDDAVPATRRVDDFQPSGDRGRHYFPERPATRPAADKRNREEIHPAAKESKRSDGRGDRQEMYFSRGGRQTESYGGRLPSRSDIPPDAANRNPPRPAVQQSPKVMHNPITGSREFGQNKTVDVSASTSIGPTTVEKNMIPKSEENAAPVTTVGEVVGGTVTAVDSSRVPNRSRPTKELYQPKGKRRYQN